MTGPGCRGARAQADWTAEEYAELLGEEVEDGKLASRTWIAADLRATWPMVTASFGPIATLLLARLAGASPTAAANTGWRWPWWS